jgi:alkaline phosphatase D
MRIDRRMALGLLAGGTAPLPARAATPEAISFLHGVASGDPGHDRVVIWTRITPERLGAELAYRWRMTPVGRRGGGVRTGAGVAGPGRDYTVKVDVHGLAPGREYAFTFECAGVTSPVGRTQTLPQGRTHQMVLAVASCALYPQGYFNAYQAIADLPRVDAVVHLGDYIYEYGILRAFRMGSSPASARAHDPPREIVTLADYRRRHAQYKSDPALQAAHARAPWIVVWDDHETANDSFTDGAQNHDPATEGDWATRKAASLKAYFEWMPIREPAGGGLAEAALRSFHFGDLASLIMLETRLTGRDQQLSLARDAPLVDGERDLSGLRAKLADPSRRMMSAVQQAWLGRELTRSVKAGHAWQVIGNEVLMARTASPDPRAMLSPAEYAAIPPEARRAVAGWEDRAALGLPSSLDRWDGYPADRERLYALFRETRARPVVVSGDSHAFWANDLSDAEGRRVACEFGATAISSPGGGEVYPGVNSGDWLARANDEVVFCDQVSNGFVLLTVTRGAVQADMVAVSTIASRTFSAAPARRFTVAPEGDGVSAVRPS